MSTPPSGDQYPGAPRWVTTFAIVLAGALIVVLVLLVASALGLHAIPSGGHGR